ncbi:DUF234 domain-containing protein [Methanospirillum sp.]
MIRWWLKDKEIDIVGINEKEKTILFCEVKWFGCHDQIC